jgi:hypothetical protein
VGRSPTSAPATPDRLSFLGESLSGNIKQTTIKLQERKINMLNTYGLTKEQIKAFGIPEDPDAPIPQETWNITVKLHFPRSTNTFCNSADFTGLNREACIALAVREITDKVGGSDKWELVECFQR